MNIIPNRWYPICYGQASDNLFKIARLVGDDRKYEESRQKFQTLDSARRECYRRNNLPKGNRQ